MERIGKYEVLGQLGQGGMGTVYRVADPDVAGRELALKLVRLGPLAAALSLERFLREAQVLARVEHPGVVKVVDCQSLPDAAYLVQELVEGELLKDVLRGRRFEPGDAARLLVGLAEAVGQVHRQGVLHRDLKPSNVMLRPDGSPVLLDFGVARDLTAETLTQTGASVGTPAYMSPEQAGGEPVDERTDVYGLGVVLYELLRGRPPFEGAPLNVIKQVMMNPPVWPSAERDDVPPDLEAVLRKAMAKAPPDRYPSAEALRADLNRFLAGEAVLARPRRPRRWPWLAALVALVAVPAFGRLRQAPTPPPLEPTAAASATEEPSDAHLLWRAPVGSTWRVRISFDERAGVNRVRMDATFACRVAARDAEVIELVLEPESIGGVFRLKVDEEATDRQEPAPLTGRLSEILQAAVLGCPLRARLARATGRLESLAGSEAMLARLERARPEVEALNADMEQLAEGSSPEGRTAPVRLQTYAALRNLLSPDYLRTALGALTEVTREPWQRSPSGWFVRASERAQLLHHAMFTNRQKHDLPARFEGNAVFRDGALESAWILQALDQESSSLRWSWEVLADPAPSWLWTVAPGRRLRLELRFREHAGTLGMRMNAILGGTVEPGAADDELALTLRLERLETEFGAMLGAFDEPFPDDTLLNPTLQAALAEGTLRVRLGRERGELRDLSGVETLQAGLSHHKEEIEAYNRRLSGAGGGLGSWNAYTQLRRMFSRSYLSAALDLLTRAGDPPWSPATRAADGASHQLLEVCKQPVLEFMTHLPKAKHDAPVDLAGTARYAGGLLESAEVSQASRSPAAPDCSVRWRWRVLPAGE